MVYKPTSKAFKKAPSSVTKSRADEYRDRIRGWQKGDHIYPQS